MKFARLDENNYVISVAGGYNEPPGPDWVRYPDGAPPQGIHKVRLIDGEFLLTGETWVPEPNYDLSRARSYPPLGDQLDALWKGLESVLDHPEADAMLKRIKEVKANNQKLTNTQ